MADYHSLLMRAVANLPNAGAPATRKAIYGRARKALLEQLRSLRPPLPESDIGREESALDAAIAQIEARFGSPETPAKFGSPETPAALKADYQSPLTRAAENFLDYQWLLTRAVENFPNPSSAATRQGIYDRARKASATQLRTLYPPLPGRDIELKERALDRAIAAVEAKFGSPGTVATELVPVAAQSGPRPGSPPARAPDSSQQQKLGLPRVGALPPLSATGGRSVPTPASPAKFEPKHHLASLEEMLAVFAVVGAAIVVESGGGTAPTPAPMVMAEQASSAATASSRSSSQSINLLSETGHSSNTEIIANALACYRSNTASGQKEEARKVWLEALNAVWSKFDSLMEEITDDALKALIEIGLVFVIHTYLVAPILQHLQRHKYNPTLAKDVKNLEILTSRLFERQAAEINEFNICQWLNESPEHVQTLLRALKLQQIGNQWVLDNYRFNAATRGAYRVAVQRPE